jgi:argininosuccinate lyase
LKHGKRIADTIVREAGISFRRAHHFVARLVRIAIEEGKRPGEVTRDMFDRVTDEMLGFPLKLDEDTICRALDPVEFINTRVTEGSVNPKEVMEMLRDSRSKLAEDRAYLQSESLDSGRPGRDSIRPSKIFTTTAGSEPNYHCLNPDART